MDIIDSIFISIGGYCMAAAFVSIFIIKNKKLLKDLWIGVLILSVTKVYILTNNNKIYTGTKNNIAVENMNVCPMDKEQYNILLTDKDLQMALVELGFYRGGTDYMEIYCSQYHIPQNYIKQFKKEFYTVKQNADEIIASKMGTEYLKCYYSVEVPKLIKNSSAVSEKTYSKMKVMVQLYLGYQELDPQFSTKDFCYALDTPKISNLMISDHRDSLVQLRKQILQ